MHQQAPLKGAAFALAAATFFAVMGSLIKLAATRLPNESIVFLRNLVAVTALVVATIADGSRRFVADLIWTDDAAPWEKVTAVYTPDITKPNKIEISDAVFADLTACREHVLAMASERGDPNLEKGSFECAVGFYPVNDDDAAGNYRLIVK